MMDKEFRGFFDFGLRRADSAEYREVMLALFALAQLPIWKISELADLAGEDDPDFAADILSRFEVAQKAMRQINGQSIERDVRRVDLPDLLDQAVAPILERLEAADAPEALMWIRDINLALQGRRKLGSVHRRFAIMPSSYGDEDEFPAQAERLARDYGKGNHLDVKVLSAKHGGPDLNKIKGVILYGHPEMRGAFFAGELKARGIPVVLLDPIGSRPEIDVELALSREAALARLQELAQGADLEEDTPIEPLREALDGVEARKMREACEKSYDRQVSREHEFMKLAKEKGFEKEFFEIYANGYRLSCEMRMTQRINLLRGRNDDLEDQIRKLSADPSPSP